MTVEPDLTVDYQRIAGDALVEAAALRQILQRLIPPADTADSETVEPEPDPADPTQEIVP